jgi:hypothetical protein
MAGFRLPSKGEGAHRLLVAAILALGSSLFLCTCGIQSTIEYFFPPNLYVITSSFSFVLSHNSSNSNAGFAGYDLYYRAFDSYSNAQTALSNLQTLASSTTSQTPYTVLNTLTATPSSSTQLNSGYVRVFNGKGQDGDPDTGQRPFFAISQGSTWTIFQPNSGQGPSVSDLTFPYTNWYFTVGTDLTEIPVMRYVTSPPGLSSFEEPFASTDPDYYYSGTGVSTTTFFVFFAVAYGTFFSSSNISTGLSFPAVLPQVITYTTGY